MKKTKCNKSIAAGCFSGCQHGMSDDWLSGPLEGGRLAILSACVFLLPGLTALVGATVFKSGGFGGIFGFVAGILVAKLAVKALGGCNKQSGETAR